MNNLLTVACYRTGSNYASCTSADLAAAISAPSALKPLSLLQFFTAAVSLGADPTEFRAIWQYQEFVRRAEESLVNGDLLAVQTLLAICPLSFSAKALAALNAVITANVLRLVDVVAAELQLAAPATVSATDVAVALGRK